MPNEETGIPQPDTELSDVMPDTDAIIEMVRANQGADAEVDGATESEEPTEGEGQTATEEEPSVDESVDTDEEESDDSEAGESESGDDEDGSETEGGEQEEKPKYYTLKELEALPPNQVDLGRIRPRYKKAWEAIKQKDRVADEKFRTAAETRKENEATLKLIEELRKQNEQQGRWREEDQRQKQEATIREQRQREYERLAEVHGEDTARLMMELKEQGGKQQQQPVDSDAAKRLEAMERELQAMRQQRDAEQIGKWIDGAISEFGVDDGAKRDVMNRAHKALFAQWEDDRSTWTNDNVPSRELTPINEVVGRVILDRERELESYREQLLTDEELRKQIAEEERKKILSELKKKKSGGEKNVGKASPGGDNAVDKGKPKVRFSDSHPDGIWEGLNLDDPEQVLRDFRDGKI